MELRYCEECGDVIRLESDEPASLHEHFICPRCKGGAPAAQSRAAPQPGRAESFSAEDLDLFSSQSIALRKQGVEPAAQKAPETRLRLVKTTETTVAEADRPVPLQPQPQLQPQRPASRRRAQAPAQNVPPPARPAPSAGIVASAPRPATAAPPLASAAPQESSGRPAKSARKIIFRCLHCKSPLSIRPVEKTSKLLCPSCGEAVYVTPDGRLLKRNPSLIVRKDSAAGGGPQPVEASTLARPGAGMRNSSQLSVAPRAATPARAPHPVAPRAPGRQPMSDEAAQTIERLSAFEEHVFSQDPNKTAFLTEESSPLSDLGRSENDEFPLADEFLSTAVEPGRSRPGTASGLEEEAAEWPEAEGWSEDEEEDWPEESDLLAEDEFDENLDSRSRKRSRARRPPTVRVMLTGIALLLPFALAVGLFVTHFSDPESRAFDPDPALTTLEKLGNAAQRGIITLFSDGEGPRGRWVPGR